MQFIRFVQKNAVFTPNHIDNNTPLMYNENVECNKYNRKGSFTMSEELEMLEEYEPVIVDLDGEEFELIDTAEIDGKIYGAFTPYTEEDEVDEEVEFIILEIIDDEDGEQCTLKTVDDEELYAKIGDEFVKIFTEEFGDE